MRIPGRSCLMTVYKRIMCKYNVCNAVSKLPLVYEYINLQNWILYISINLVIPCSLKSGVVGAVYPPLQIFLIDFCCNSSSLCSPCWYPDSQNIVLYKRREWRRLWYNYFKLSTDKYHLTVWIAYESLYNCIILDWWLLIFVDFPAW